MRFIHSLAVLVLSMMGVVSGLYASHYDFKENVVPTIQVNDFIAHGNGICATPGQADFMNACEVPVPISNMEQVCDADTNCVGYYCRHRATTCYLLYDGSSTKSLDTNTQFDTYLKLDSGGHGDPQFVGFHGQSYQVHGYPETWFNIITAPEFSVNAKFAYLASGTCDYNNTQCWTHPGTYMDAFGITLVVRDGVMTNSTQSLAVSVHTGSHAAGLTVTINGSPLPIGTVATFPCGSSIRRPSYDIVTLITPTFHLTITNADDFANIQTALTHSILTLGRKKVDMTKIKGYTDVHTCKQGSYPENIHVHGLLGQTWRNAVYGAGRLYEGCVHDYICSGQFSYDSVFHATGHVHKHEHSEDSE